MVVAIRAVGGGQAEFFSLIQVGGWLTRNPSVIRVEGWTTRTLLCYSGGRVAKQNLSLRSGWEGGQPKLFSVIKEGGWVIRTVFCDPQP